MAKVLEIPFDIVCFSLIFLFFILRLMVEEWSRHKQYRKQQIEWAKRITELEKAKKEKLERDKIRQSKPRGDWTIEDWNDEYASESDHHPQKIYWYEQWILKRDNYQCKFCGCKDKSILHAYRKQRSPDDLQNIRVSGVEVHIFFITLCDYCYFEHLSPRSFERFAGKIFEKMGYSVSLTGTTGDEGIDLICTRKDTNEKVVVQCKKYKGAVGSPVVRNFYGSMIHSNASKGYIVTTGHFTSNAIDWAKGKPIEFIDRDKLIKFLNGSLRPGS